MMGTGADERLPISGHGNRSPKWVTQSEGTSFQSWDTSLFQERVTSGGYGEHARKVRTVREGGQTAANPTYCFSPMQPVQQD